MQLPSPLAHLSSTYVMFDANIKCESLHQYSEQRCTHLVLCDVWKWYIFLKPYRPLVARLPPDGVPQGAASAGSGHGVDVHGAHTAPVHAVPERQTAPGRGRGNRGPQPRHLAAPLGNGCFDVHVVSCGRVHGIL
jgi:hypothetical protein